MTDTFVQEARKIIALNALRLIGPDEVVDWASEQIPYRQNEPLLQLASMRKPATSASVGDALFDLAKDLKIDINMESAGLCVARQLAQQIVDGSVNPFEGARRIWWNVAQTVPQLEGLLRPFIGLASEWEDDPAHRAEYDRDILEQAQRLLSRT